MIGGADGSTTSSRPATPRAADSLQAELSKDHPIVDPSSSNPRASFDPVKHSSAPDHPSQPIKPHQMAHRPEPYPPPNPHKRGPYHPVDGRPSPPPIATLHTTSPSPSISSQHNSPAMHARSNLPPMGYYERAPPPPQQMAAPPPYAYGPPPPHPVYSNDPGYPPNGMPPMMSHPMGPPRGPPGADYHTMTFPGSQTGLPVIHTDDAATKLSDRVRRRCFNCCTTDTSTWRRSNLSPGKVLCNKCGLFERTHSRPRPEQFPHKRGPLASSSLSRGAPRGPAVAQHPPQQVMGPAPPQAVPHHDNQLPPIQPPPQNGSHHYAAGYSIPPIQDAKPSKSLPELNSWVDRGDDRRQPPPPQGEKRSPKPDTNDNRDNVTLPRLEIKDAAQP